MDYQRLLQTTESILTLRGSAGSGNYGHDGRPGKLGGSSKGGGLKRIGAKKDTPPGDRKKAAEKFREKRQRQATKGKGVDKSISLLRSNVDNLVEIGPAGQGVLENFHRGGVEKLTGQASGKELETINKLTKSGMAAYDGETFKLTAKGKQIGKAISDTNDQLANIGKLARSLSGSKRSSDDFFKMSIDGYKELLDHEKHLLALSGIGLTPGSKKRVRDTEKGYLPQSELGKVAKRIDNSLKEARASEILSKKSDYDTGQISNGRAVELKSLIDLTWQVMVLRGGPTSGNWGHSGRPGKKGGSGRGGGFGKIGIKNGKQAGRGKVKQASRQTRSKEERAGGAGVGASSGAIPAAVVDRAKTTVGTAKAKRDKELSITRKGEIAIEKAREKGLKAQEKYFNSADKTREAYQGFLKAGDEDAKASQAVFDFLNTNPKLSDPKVRAKADKLQAQSTKARKAHDKAVEKFQRIDKQNIKNRQAYDKANAELGAVSAKHKNDRKAKDIMTDYQKETEQASRVLFQHHLNEAKQVRKNLIDAENNRNNRIKELENIREKQSKALDKVGTDDITRFLAEGAKLANTNKELSQLKASQMENTRSLVQVNSPTRIAKAPGSETDRSKLRKDNWKTGIDGFQNLVSDDVVPRGTPVQFANTEKGRSFHQAIEPHSRVSMAEFAGPNTMAHELGHMAEHENPRLLKRSLEWRDRRTKGEDYQSLADLTGLSYDDSERAKPDKFFHPYIGKDYGNRASEVFSMGIEEMHRDPVGFAQRDPDMFDFIYAQARTP